MAAHKNRILKAVCMVTLISAAAWLSACGGQQTQAAPDSPQAQPQAQSQPEPAQPEIEKDAPLAKAYQVILIEDFESVEQIAKDYPDAHRECQNSLLWGLRDKKAYKQVENSSAAGGNRAGALLVKAKITDMRMVSGAARFWGGAWAGASFINVDLKLIDASTKAVVREKKVESANNAWAAAWNMGSSDRSLPADMGKILAEYITSVMPAK